MKLSEQRRAALYKAIRDPIMEARIAIVQRQMKGEELDQRLFLLEQEIWESVKQSLKLEGE